jgi:hypothetical protein
MFSSSVPKLLGISWSINQNMSAYYHKFQHGVNLNKKLDNIKLQLIVPQKYGSYLKSRTPFVFQNVKAYPSELHKKLAVLEKRNNKS